MCWCDHDPIASESGEYSRTFKVSLIGVMSRWNWGRLRKGECCSCSCSCSCYWRLSLSTLRAMCLLTVLEVPYLHRFLVSKTDIRKQAEYVRDEFTRYGLNASIIEYEVKSKWMNWLAILLASVWAEVPTNNWLFSIYFVVFPITLYGAIV